MIVTMTARLLKNAKAQNGMFTAATRASLMKAAESFCAGIPNHSGTPQLMVLFLIILFCEDNRFLLVLMTTFLLPYHPIQTSFFCSDLVAPRGGRRILWIPMSFMKTASSVTATFHTKLLAAEFQKNKHQVGVFFFNVKT